VAPPRDQVVDGVAKDRRDETEDNGEAPRTAEISSRLQAGGGSDMHPFGRAASGGLDPDHRVHARKVRMTCANRLADVAFERREPQDVRAFVPQDESNALSTEPARPVVEKERGITA
jgi:hypothetical protein